MTRLDKLGQWKNGKGMTMRSCGAMLILLAVSSLTGCAEFEFIKWKKDIVVLKATPQNPAVECLCIWQPAEGRGVNGLPTRGFAGSIMFFTHKGAAPVEVEGDVRIYQFDNRGTAEEQAKPIHQFDFTPEVWKAHLHEGMLGPSYQVFVPYMRKDGYQAECALRVRLQAPGVPVIYSEMVSVTLPGTPLEPSGPTKPIVVPSATSEGVKAATIPLTQSRDAAKATEAHARLASAIQDGLAAPRHPAAPRSPAAGTPPEVKTTARPAASAADERLDRLEAMMSKFLEQQQTGDASTANPPGGSAEEPETPRFRLAPARSASTTEPGDDELSTSREELSSRKPAAADGTDRDWWTAAAPLSSTRRPHPLREVEPSQTAQMLPAFESPVDRWSR